MAANDIKILQEQADGSLKETLLTPVVIGAAGFQPNPEILPDEQSGVLANGTLLPRENVSWGFRYITGNAYERGETVVEPVDSMVSGVPYSGRWRFRETSCGSEDCYDRFFYESTNGGLYPWLATWPAGVNVIKGELPRAGGAALSSIGAEGNSYYAARADHTHPFPTAQQVGAAPTVHNHSAATPTASGFISAQDKNKLDASVTTAFLNNTGIRNSWWSTPTSPNFAGRLVQSVLPSLIVNNVSSYVFEPEGFKNSYLFWKRGDEELVHAPTTPFYQGIGALSILQHYVSYGQIGTSPAGQPSNSQPSLRGGVVLIQGSTETRRVRQFFTVSGQEYAYVIDYPQTGNPASGPEQLELWTSNSGGLAHFSSSHRVISRVAVLGRTLDFTWRPTSGTHWPTFRFISVYYDSETGEFVDITLGAQANVTNGSVQDNGGRQFYPVWNLSWGTTTVAPRDEMAVLEGPVGSNNTLVSIKTPSNQPPKGSRLQWQPKDGRIFVTETAQNSVSSSSWLGAPESAVFLWRTTHASGVFATGALTLPSVEISEPGQRHLLIALNAVTAFTLNVNGNTIYGATVPSSLSANQTLEWVCVASATWVRIR